MGYFSGQISIGFLTLFLQDLKFALKAEMC